MKKFRGASTVGLQYPYYQKLRRSGIRNTPKYTEVFYSSGKCGGKMRSVELVTQGGYGHVTWSLGDEEDKLVDRVWAEGLVASIGWSPFFLGLGISRAQTQTAASPRSVVCHSFIKFHLAFVYSSIFPLIPLIRELLSEWHPFHSVKNLTVERWRIFNWPWNQKIWSVWKRNPGSQLRNSFYLDSSRR